MNIHLLIFVLVDVAFKIFCMSMLISIYGGLDERPVKPFVFVTDKKLTPECTEIIEEVLAKAYGIELEKKEK